MAADRAQLLAILCTKGPGSNYLYKARGFPLVCRIMGSLATISQGPGVPPVCKSEETKSSGPETIFLE